MALSSSQRSALSAISNTLSAISRALGSSGSASASTSAPAPSRASTPSPSSSASRSVSSGSSAPKTSGFNLTSTTSPFASSSFSSGTQTSTPAYSLTPQVSALKKQVNQTIPTTTTTQKKEENYKLAAGSPLLSSEFRLGNTANSTPTYQSQGNSYNTSGQITSSSNNNLAKSIGAVKSLASRIGQGMSSLASNASNYTSSVETGVSNLQASRPQQPKADTLPSWATTAKMGGGSAPAIETLTSQTRPGYQAPTATTPTITPEQRNANRQRAAELSANRQNLIAEKTEQLKAAQDALATLQTEGYDDEGQLENVRALEAEIDQYRQELNGLEQPTAEEQALLDEENALVAREAKIKTDLKGAEAEFGNQPIPYGFISGYKAYAQNRANADLEGIAAERIPLTQKLATLQARRQAAQDVAKRNMEAITRKYERNQDFYRDQTSTKRREQQEMEAARQKQEQESQKVTYETRTLDMNGVPMQYRIGYQNGQVVSMTPIGQAYYKPSESSNDDNLY